MDVALLEQIAADLLTSATLEEDIIWYHHTGTPTDLEQGEDVLHEVKLFVASRGPEVVADDNPVLLFRFAFLVYESQAALLAKGGVGQNHRILLAPGSSQSVHSSM